MSATQRAMLDWLDPSPCHESCQENEATTLGSVTEALVDWHDREIAHAVALEREAIIAYLQRQQAEHYAAFDDSGSWVEQEHGIALDIAWQDISQGKHNPQTPTSGAGAATRATEAPIGATDASSAENGPHEPETGMDSCRPSPESEDA